MTKRNRCATPTPCVSGDIQLDGFTLNWLTETGGLVDILDKSGRKTGDCFINLQPLIYALEELCPDGTTIEEFSQHLRNIKHLTVLKTFLNAVENAPPEVKAEAKRVMADCVLSEDAHNTIGFGSDGGLFENETL